MNPVTAQELIDQLRTWLAQGATIKAVDPDGVILQETEFGIVHGGLLIDIPRTGLGWRPEFPDGTDCHFQNNTVINSYAP